MEVNRSHSMLHTVVLPSVPVTAITTFGRCSSSPGKPGMIFFAILPGRCHAAFFFASRSVPCAALAAAIAAINLAFDISMTTFLSILSLFGDEELFLSAETLPITRNHPSRCRSFARSAQSPVKSPAGDFAPIFQKEGFGTALTCLLYDLWLLWKGRFPQRGGEMSRSDKGGRPL